MAISQNGYPASRNRGEIGVQTLAVPGTAVQLPVRGDIAALLLTMAQWFGQHVEPLRSGECHGYAYRAIAGSTQLSNHSSGTAIDLNAPSHPLGKRGTEPNHLRGQISAKARELGLRWGGDHLSRVDEMHFEVNIPLAEALDLVRRRSNGNPVRPVRPMIRRGSRGEAVRELQTILNRDHPDFSHLEVDGVFGSKTDAVVREFQRRARLRVDGIVGPLTWGRLLG